MEIVGAGSTSSRPVRTGGVSHRPAQAPTSGPSGLLTFRAPRPEGRSMFPPRSRPCSVRGASQELARTGPGSVTIILQPGLDASILPARMLMERSYDERGPEDGPGVPLLSNWEHATDATARMSPANTGLATQSMAVVWHFADLCSTQIRSPRDLPANGASPRTRPISTTPTTAQHFAYLPWMGVGSGGPPGIPGPNPDRHRPRSVRAVQAGRDPGTARTARLGPW
jgi:hypothetical protein